MFTKKKCQILLHNAYKRYLKCKGKLPAPALEETKEVLKRLQDAIQAGDKTSMKKYGKEVSRLLKTRFKKPPLQTLVETIIGLAVALAVAALFRPMVFELYVVPTGSMRPTILEQDRLYVTKTAFGINVPMMPMQLYFDPSLVKRNDGVAFTGEGLAIPNVDVMNFYIFPGKKQLVKRLLGKPGDTLYYYGGQIYGIDANGNDISEKLQPNYLSYVKHVPFITFEGKVETTRRDGNDLTSTVEFLQYNMPVAELSALSPSMITGKLLPQKNLDGSSRTFTRYYQMWGMENYGMVRLLTNKQARSFSKGKALESGTAAAYLEITHHPNLYTAKVGMDIRGKMRPQLGTFTSYLPLSEMHLQMLFAHMTTMRFIVKDGMLSQYSYEGIRKEYHKYAPKMAGIPNGTYEYLNGQAYKVLSMGFTKKLGNDHPLMQYSPEKTLFFFNLGIDMFAPFAPQSADDIFRPHRYTYYKNGELYLMGEKIVEKNDPLLVRFLENEYALQSAATTLRPYPPFQDTGAPLLPDGKLDITRIREFGLVIPEKHYLALGDNYEASLDSRDFGFLPERNIRGAPTFTFWPISSRFGFFPSPKIAFINPPRIIIWAIVLGIVILVTISSRKKRNKPLTFE